MATEVSAHTAAEMPSRTTAERAAAATIATISEDGDGLLPSTTQNRFNMVITKENYRDSIGINSLDGSSPTSSVTDSIRAKDPPHKPLLTNTKRKDDTNENAKEPNGFSRQDELGILDDTLHWKSPSQESQRQRQLQCQNEEDLCWYNDENSCIFFCDQRPVIASHANVQNLVAKCLKNHKMGCPGPIPCWDVSRVTNMDGAFDQEPLDGEGSVFRHSLCLWDVSSVTSMSAMFFNSKFNLPIDSWNISRVKNTEWMFYASDFNQPIGFWDTSSVTSMAHMFYSSYFNQDIGSWNTSSVETMRELFYSAKDFNQPINDWDISRVTDMKYIFDNTYSFHQCMSKWPMPFLNDDPKLCNHSIPHPPPPRPRECCVNFEPRIHSSPSVSSATVVGWCLLLVCMAWYLLFYKKKRGYWRFSSTSMYSRVARGNNYSEEPHRLGIAHMELPAVET